VDVNEKIAELKRLIAHFQKEISKPDCTPANRWYGRSYIDWFKLWIQRLEE
jgi:hypothetical protein